MTERWPGGMLTNFPTIRKAVKKMTNIDKLTADGTFSNLSKREILQISRQRAKLEKNLGSIADLTRLPAALFVVDVCKEHIAVKEAIRLGIPVFGIVDSRGEIKATTAIMLIPTSWTSLSPLTTMQQRASRLSSTLVALLSLKVWLNVR